MALGTVAPLDLRAKMGDTRYPLDLNTSLIKTAHPAEVNITDLLGRVLRHRMVFVLVFAVALATSTTIILSLQRQYQSEALIMVDPRQTNAANFRLVQDEPIGSDLNFVRSQMHILTSNEIAHHVVVNMDLQNDPAFRAKPGIVERLIHAAMSRLPGRLESWLEPIFASATPVPSVEAAVARYKDLFSAYSDGKSSIISASFSAPDPVFAQRVLSRHLAIYQETQLAARGRLIKQTEAWFDSELTALHRKLLVAESRQQMFRQANKLLRTGGETIVSRQLASITVQLNEARSDLVRKETRQAALRGVDGGRPMADTATLSSELLQRLRERQAVSTQRIASMEQNYGSGYPPLLAERKGLADVQARIAGETQRLAASAENDAAIARQNVAQLQSQLDDASAKLGVTSNDELIATQIEREVEVDRHLYDDLLLRSKQVSIQGQLQDSDTRTVSTATLPLRPSYPRRGLLLAISVMAASVLGGVAALVADLLNRRRAATLGDIGDACGLPGLAAIPWLKTSVRGRPVPPAPGTYLAAALHRLRNSIAFRCDNHSPQVTVFASALPGDGKTMLAAAYAGALAEGGQRVLLVDADMRRRGLTQHLGLDGTSGLAQCLTGTPLEACIIRGDTGVDVLAAGDHVSDPGALLMPDRVQPILTAARQRYAVVILDTPPVTVIDDALPFVAQADAVVMVARWKRTPLASVNNGLARIALTGGNVVGVAMTATNMRKYDPTSDTPVSFSPTKSYYLVSP